MNSKKTVLITDDSKTNQELLTAILGDKYQYLYAENGAQLIEMLGSGLEADIILLDINMPYVDGFQVLQVMSQRHWLEETPVVVISAEDDHVFLQRAYALGAADYIPHGVPNSKTGKLQWFPGFSFVFKGFPGFIFLFGVAVFWGIFADFTHKLPMKLPTKTAAICSPRYCPRKKRLLPMRFPLISLPSYADRHFLAYL